MRVFKNKLFIIISILLLSMSYMPNAVAAGALTAVSDTMSNLNASAVSNHLIVFTTPTGVAGSQAITLTFPAGFTMGSVAFGDMDLQDDGSDVTLAATSTGTTWGAAVSGQVVTFTNGSTVVAAGSVITIKIGTNATGGTNQITNPTAGNDLVVSIAGSFTDTGKFALSIISNDQIPVTASVDPQLTLTVANTTFALGTLTSGAIATAGPNLVTIASNSSRGYSITIKDVGDNTNPGLNNSIASHRIPSASGAIAAGTEKYGGVCDTSGSPSGTCTYATNASGNVNAFGVSSATTFASLAAGTKPASGGDQYNLRVRAAVATTTDSGAYSDTLTVIGTMTY